MPRVFKEWSCGTSGTGDGLTEEQVLALAVKPDYEAAEGDAAGILNKPDLTQSETYNVAKAAANGYVEGVSRILWNGYPYILNTDAVLQAARGNTDTVDQTVLPSDGDGSDSADWVRRLESKKGFMTFSEMVNSDITGYNCAETVCHHAIIYFGGARYIRDGSTGSPSTGDESKFYDSAGSGFVFDICQNGCVRKFGAKGDGVTDDAVSIQKAFDSVVTEVVLSSGDYLLGTTGSDYIQLNSTHSGMVFRGSGGRLKLADNSPVLSSKSAIQIDGADNLSINKIRFYGNAEGNTENTSSSTGLVGFSNVLRSDGVMFTQNHIERSNNGGVYFTTGSQRGICSHNVFRNCFGTEMRVGEPDGLKVAEGVFVGNTVIVDSDVHATSPKQDGMLTVRWGGDATFVGNKIILAEGVVLNPAALIWVVNVRRLTISGNEVINESTVGTSGGGYFVQGNISSDAESIVITGNTATYDQGILLSSNGATRNVGSINISNNTISAKSQSGIIAKDLLCDSTIIEGNNVAYGGGNGVEVGVAGAVINSNVVNNNGGSHGIFLDGTDIVCSGNVIDMGGAVSRGVEIYASDSIVSNNRIKNYAGLAIREQGVADWNLISSNHAKGGTVLAVGANTTSTSNV